MSSEAKTLKSFGINLKTARKSSGITQEYLAELCDFDPTYISLLEGGKRNPTLTTIAILAKNLKCKISTLTDI